MLDICSYFITDAIENANMEKNLFFWNLFLSDTNFYYSSTVDFILSEYKAHACFHQLLQTNNVW